MKKPLKQSDEKILEAFSKLQSDGWYQPYSIMAELLEVPKKNFIFWLSRQSANVHYTRYIIPKRSGGRRIILAPHKQLKMLQQRLNYVLQLLTKSKPVVHGFTQGKSIITNAECHVGKRHVLNFDLLNFFPSIHSGRVNGLFQSGPFNLPPKAAAAFAKLCTYDNALPQGAPTSPIISNLICRGMDNQLAKLAREYGCVYTRYADDITISTHQKKFPPHLAIRAGAFVSLGDGLTQIIEANDFRLNHSKTRLLSQKDRQIVTGLVVNKRVNVTRKYIRQVRGMLHALEKYGLDAASHEFFTKHYFKHSAPDSETPGFEAVLLGKLTFLKQVRESGEQIDALSRSMINKFYTLTGQKKLLLPVTQEELDKLNLYKDLKNVKAISDARLKGIEFEKFLFRACHEIGVRHV